MPRGLKFKRRIRVVVGGEIVTNIDPAASASVNEGRSLDVAFSTASHVKAEPLPTTLKVWNLNKSQRELLTNAQTTAAQIAWQEYQQIQNSAVLVEDSTQITQFQQQLVTQGGIITIEAGYDGDFALLARAQILPEGVEHEYDGDSWVTTITAQDTRYPWQNSFTSESVAPGVRLSDLQALLQLSEQFLLGEVDRATVLAAEPSLLETKKFGGYLNGRVLHGGSRDFELEIMERLSLVRFMDRGVLRFLSSNSVTLADAVVLQQVPKRDLGVPVPGGMLKYKVMKRGFVEVQTLLDHRLTAGRQVILSDELGAPIGGGVYRVDDVQHVGTNFDVSYNSTALCRPVTVDAAANV